MLIFKMHARRANILYAINEEVHNIFRKKLGPDFDIIPSALHNSIEISEETYEKIKDQLTEEESICLVNYDEMIGGKSFFRTVTYHLVGKVVGRMGDFLWLENASWVADSGRFMQAIKNGQLKEVEPVGSCGVNLKAVTDFFPWKHPLPKEQK